MSFPGKSSRSHVRNTSGKSVNFPKVCKRLRRAGSLTKEETDALEAARRHWRQTCESSGGIRINLGSRTLTPRDYIDIYFNSLYFHRRDKAERAMRDRL